MCFGHDCSSWDDAIDRVGVMDEIHGRPGPFVMTTWHANEPMEDVVDFFASMTRFEDWAPSHFVVLLVGGSDRSVARVEATVERRFRGEGT